MQRCLHCGEKFKYWSVLRSGMFRYQPMYCQSCNAKHKITPLTPLIISLDVVAIPTISFMLVKKYIYTYKTFYEFALIYLLCALPIVSILPFLMRFERASIDQDSAAEQETKT